MWHTMDTQDFFGILSDTTRRRLLSLFLVQGELCVCELTAALDMPQPKTSRHLAIMREAGLLSLRREGTWIFYRLDPQLPLWAYRILETLARDSPDPFGKADSKRLADMAGRPVRCCA
ncbi:MAG: transcriptional regulator [Hydrogenophilaceae bacterium CG1_02_62_390]|nr:MAG: transcriptional regulator [Hydrogenophilaceae bacterium CG1_02_62_390]